MPLKTNFLYFLPFIGAIIDWIKQAIFLLSRSSCGSSCGASKTSTINLFALILLVFVSTFFAIILSFLPTIWVSLLPALALLLPLFAKIASQSSRRKHYLTKYQICYWICVSIWMVIILLVSITPPNRVTFIVLPISTSSHHNHCYREYSSALFFSRSDFLLLLKNKIFSLFFRFLCTKCREETLSLLYYHKEDAKFLKRSQIAILETILNIHLLLNKEEIIPNSQ